MIKSVIKTFCIKCLVLISFQIMTNNAECSQVIGKSTQSTATERNNARLIVEDLTGALHIVYYNNGIYHSISYDNGNSWTTAFEITNIGRNPSIAIDNQNILHLVYKYGGTSAYDIVHQTFNNKTWSGINTVYHDGNTTVSRPVIAIDTENNLHCVWQRASNSSTPNSEIWYNTCLSDSGWGNNPVNISNSYGASEYPTLVIDKSDRISIFWKDSGEESDFLPKKILSRQYNTGKGWDDNYTIICETTGNDNWATMDPSVIIDSDNKIHLVWKDAHTGIKNIYYKNYINGTWSSRTSISLTDNASDRPIISIDGQDNLFVVWEEKTDGIYYDIVYKKYTNNTNTWEEIINVSNTSRIDSKHPSIPTFTKDSLLIIWTEGEGFPYDILINRNYCTLTANMLVTNETATGANDGSITVNTSGGISPYSYLWDNNTGNQTTQTATGLSGGIYFATVTDGNNCTIIVSDTIKSMTTIQETDKFNFAIYPNPASDVLFIETPDIGKKRVEICNIYGQTLYVSNNYYNEFISIGLSGYMNGIYFVKLYCDAKIHLHKIIIH